LHPLLQVLSQQALKYGSHKTVCCNVAG
jgi:hypothetical protein